MPADDFDTGLHERARRALADLESTLGAMELDNYGGGRTTGLNVYRESFKSVRRFIDDHEGLVARGRFRPPALAHLPQLTDEELRTLDEAFRKGIEVLGAEFDPDSLAWRRRASIYRSLSTAIAEAKSSAHRLDRQRSGVCPTCGARLPDHHEDCGEVRSRGRRRG